MTKDSLAVAIEALSWMAYTGMGERQALLRASQQMNVTEEGALREAHKWIMETSRFQNRLDWFISQCLPAEAIEKTPHGVRSLFRVITYAKLIESRSPADLQRLVGWARQAMGWHEIRPYEEDIAKLVFGKRNAILTALTELDRLSLRTCHPSWYTKSVTVAFGRPIGIRMLQRDLRPVSTFARINELKATGEYDLIAEQLHASKVDKLDGVFVLEKAGKSGERANLASSGKIVIQDLGSIVAGLVAAPKPGQAVLDLCASPGNKTSHFAAQMHNEGEIYSIEYSPTRTAQWRRSVASAGCSIAHLIRADARTIPLRGDFDVVLVDPPCSNTGVFARNPPAKWEISHGQLHELSSRQEKILQTASNHVSKGGTLVYCTCSMLAQENEFIVETFLGRNPDFKLVRQEPFIGSPGLRGLNECQRFYPHLHDCNGYFIAMMHRDA